LAEQLDAMEDAAEEGDLERLAQLAHWLKGSGGNVGFAAFHEPARQLEQLVREGQREGTAALVAHLRGLEARIVVPPLENPDQLQTAGS
jgi:HPt (histidine-containing phosphotransfer) domain-containing protein